MKRLPVPGAPRMFTSVPWSTSCVHVGWPTVQSRSGLIPSMVPLAVGPALVTALRLRRYCFSVEVTVTLRSPVMTPSGQDRLVPRKAQASPQPLKMVPTGTEAFSVTDVPATNVSEQSVAVPGPQLMPAGVELTLTPPFPDRPTVTVLAATKLATTVLLAFTSTVHTTPLTLVQPVHVLNLACAPAFAVSCTVWPLGKNSLHVSLGQSMPGGLVSHATPGPPEFGDATLGMIARNGESLMPGPTAESVPISSKPSGPLRLTKICAVNPSYPLHATTARPSGPIAICGSKFVKSGSLRTSEPVPNGTQSLPSKTRA